MNINEIEQQLIEARKTRNHLAARLSNYKQKAKDTTKVETELEDVRKKIIELNAQYEAANNGSKRIKKAKTEPTGKVNQPDIKSYKIKGPSEAEQEQIRKAAAIENKKITGREPKSWTKTELGACQKTMEKILDENDWKAGYQFRSSECMFIRHIRTILLPDSVELEYTIEYKTKNHRISKVVTKYFNPDTIQKLTKYIEDVEMWVMLNSGDMDDKTIIFGPRFNKVQFDAQGMAEKGWVLHK